MRYLINQGSFDCPFPFEDHSNNVLLLTDPESNELIHVSIIRDRLEAEETIETYIKRQFKIIKRKFPSYVELSRKSIRVEKAGLDAIQIEARSKETGYVTSQIQTVILMQNSQDILIFNVAVTGPLTNTHREWWERLINSFTLTSTEE